MSFGLILFQCDDLQTDQDNPFSQAVPVKTRAFATTQRAVLPSSMSKLTLSFGVSVVGHMLVLVLERTAFPCTCTMKWLSCLVCWLTRV